MNTRIVATLAGATLLLTTSSAWALDAWRDRRGLYYGATVGAGSGQLKLKEEIPGAEDLEGELGLNVRLRVGGGATKNLTLDAELGLWSGLDDDPLKPTAGITTGFIGANVFVADGFYLRGFGGLTYMSLDDADADAETGLGVGFGAGYEFFANSDLAVGVGADYQMHFYDDYEFNLFNLGVSLNYY
ncbi:MAG: outer membrane beta-barrel protein [Bradymonadia bacterium]